MVLQAPAAIRLAQLARLLRVCRQVIEFFRNGNCIFRRHHIAIFAIDDKFMKLFAWYDNEYGYTCMAMKLIKHMYEVDHK